MPGNERPRIEPGGGPRRAATDPAGGTLSIVAGNGTYALRCPPATTSPLDYPTAVTLDNASPQGAAWIDDGSPG